MLTLILGGARSGKSDLAQRLAAASRRDVLVVATMQPRDDELRLRVAQHQATRPAGWRTIEEPHDVVAALEEHARPGGFVIVDCMTMWVSNLLIARLGDGDDIEVEDAAAATEQVLGRAQALAEWASTYDGDLAVVTNEVGLGVVPAYALGRAFRDALGGANAALARAASQVYYLVAGLAIELKSAGAQALDVFGEAPAT
ncbi:MAG: bifunctional adenosylcobinamide kinase/adenosylcobinamide-phosphate guanylyltransferase [Chloroflexi bacterium]|nr:bifunctional adenosylcobinamide kinase/adenosylcobinamide-phosphate guanylyltransferase [Chloroflexota bacterium]